MFNITRNSPEYHREVVGLSREVYRSIMNINGSLRNVQNVRLTLRTSLKTYRNVQNITGKKRTNEMNDPKYAYPYPAQGTNGVNLWSPDDRLDNHPDDRVKHLSTAVVTLSTAAISLFAERLTG
ncbi:hypothetical protein TEA_019129 [Camellia sinensis var. sinensis]|uniref:Uncharacterized protein n=1 Tax=Camellia sinensis var. sinensis TaxID=542762 RepID=A0A4S4DBC8_CAMSN|nr:hypothetical protein TEA_019129 [Camellia sinensis var. sinensis]